MEQKMLLNGINFKDYVNVLAWNKAGLKWKKRLIQKINKIIIHQSLSEGSLTAINNYLISPGNHVSPANGCPHIAYHMAIGKDGQIFLCNNFDDITWHTKGQNEVSLGICLLGNFTGTGYNKGSEPTKLQLDSLDLLLKRLITNFGSSITFSGKNIYGHYHFGKPACPGKTISGKIENFRNGIVVELNRLDSIKDIQLALIKLGYSLPKYGSDGFYGTETKLALVKLQTENNIPVTGYADELTRQTISVKLSLKDNNNG